MFIKFRFVQIPLENICLHLSSLTHGINKDNNNKVTVLCIFPLEMALEGPVNFEGFIETSL